MEIEGTRNLKNLGGPCSLFLMGKHLYRRQADNSGHLS